MRDQERDILRKTILLLLQTGSRHYRDVEKKVVASCFPFATSNTVEKQFYGYLIPCGYVERVERGVYRLTEKGVKLLAILNNR